MANSLLEACAQPTRLVTSFRLFLVSIALLGAGRAFAFELPVDVATRNDGAWRISRTGTISDGKTTFDVSKTWTICLDGRADRALYELAVLKQQASVASLNERCAEPRATFTGETVTWAMHCSGPSPIEDKIGKTDIHHTTTLLTGDETRSETVIVNRDNLIESRSDFVTHMERTGGCQEGWRPGDMMLMHWRVNGEETLKGRQRQNVFHQISDYKTFIASQLERRGKPQ